LGSVRAGKGKGASAELCRQHSGEVSAGIAQSRREPRDSFAFDDAVADEAHCTGGEVVVEVPVRGAGYCVWLASLAGT
jgi:hypothetical protein